MSHSRQEKERFVNDYNRGVRQDQDTPDRVRLDPQARAVVTTIRAGLIAQADAVDDEVTRLLGEFPDEPSFVRGLGNGMTVTLNELIKVCEEVLAW